MKLSLVEDKAGFHFCCTPLFVPFHWSQLHLEEEPLREHIWRSWLHRSP